MTRCPPCGRARTGVESGVSLIEVVISVFIMGVAFAVIVGGLGTAIIGSDLQRRQADADVALRATAETISYDPCGTAASYTPASSPAGLTVTVARVTYWNGDDKYEEEPGGAAPATCATDPPLQLLDLEAESTGGRLISRSLQVVKRP